MSDTRVGKQQILVRTALASGPVLAIVTYLMFPGSLEHPLVARTAAVAVWMGIWWLTEAVPLAVTSLLPLVFFPLFGVMKASDVASQYMNDVVFLFIGGFLVALAMERWSLHRRIALHVMRLIGGGKQRTLLGFMVATALLSMWISNTATAMMMIPIASAVLTRYEDHLQPQDHSRLAVGMFLGVAYAASIGGIATLVGTPPNLAFARIFALQFPNGPEITFAEWIVFALPVSLVMLAAAWGLLSLMYLRGSATPRISHDVFRNELNRLGPIRYEEKVVLGVFLSLAFLWITRKPIDIGAFVIPGWSQILPEPGYAGDGTVAIAFSTLLFVLPARGGHDRIMTWETARKLPWGIVLLFGGGFALAKAITVSGLSAWIGLKLQGLSTLQPVAMTASISTLMTFLTELTSNTATTQMTLPILAATAVAIGRNPFFLMIPATLSASFAFMMPVATPPNAIIFGTGKVRVAQMAKTGLILNLVGIVVITLWLFLAGTAHFGSGPEDVPAWSVPAKIE